jgi:hypothetical protein
LTVRRARTGEASGGSKNQAMAHQKSGWPRTAVYGRRKHKEATAMTEESRATDTTHAVADAIEQLERLVSARLGEENDEQLHILSSLCAHWDRLIGNELMRRFSAARTRRG